MFKCILHIAYKNSLNVLVSILIIAFTFNATGCYSSFTGEVNPENMEVDVNCNIIKVTMKDGLVINLKNREAIFLKKYQGQSNVVVYKTSDKQNVEDGLNRSTSKTNVLKLEDIKSLFVSNKEINIRLTILAAILIVSPIALLIALGAIGSGLNH